MDVKLKFYGLGYNNINQAYVTIYDECNNIVFKGKTYNGCLLVGLYCNRIYKLVATSLGEVITTNIYVNSNYYSFRFSYNMISNNLDGRTVTFVLTDYYYDDLKIERGEIILWQNQ